MILIDSREKPKAIAKIIDHFQQNDIKYDVTKLYIGDYQRYDNPMILIDRKQNVAEIAQNATSGHARFKRELERLKSVGAKMYILIEQDKIDGEKINNIDDIIGWTNKYGEVCGYQVYRILAAWEAKYNIEYVFCSKRNTGKEIVRLLNE